MIKNYLIIALRNLFRNKWYVVVNILGIGIAIASCIVAYYNVKFHYDFNNQHQKKNQIYKINTTQDDYNRRNAYGVSPITLGKAIGSSIAGIEETVRYANPTMVVRCGEHVFNKRIGFADDNFFELFDFEFVSGSADQLKNKNSVLISQSMATTCFGADEAMGKFLSMFSDDGVAYTFIVGGVYHDLPQNSSFRCQVISLIDNFIEIRKLDELNWKAWASATFLLIPDESKVETITKEINKFVAVQNDFRPDWLISSFYLDKFSDIPTKGRKVRNNSLRSGLHPAALKVPPIMAAILLILACLNYMNTSLAISGNRLNEIGVRKTMGSIRWHIILQFLAENVIVCFLGLVVGLLMSTYLLDAFSDMWPNMTLKLNLIRSFDLWAVLFALLLFTGILAGAYPAFYISKFNPVRILKGDVKYGGVGILSKILLVIQFSFAIMGIICAFLFIQNAKYQENLDMGFNKKNVLVLPIDDHSKLLALKNEIEKNPKVKIAGLSKHHIGRYSQYISLSYNEMKKEIILYDIGRNYIDAMGLKLLSGENFDMNFKESDREKAIIVNQKLIESFGWEDEPIGKKLELNDTVSFRVVGVVQNFYAGGFWRRIQPTILRLGKKNDMHHLVINAEEKHLSQINENLKSIWKANFPDVPYSAFYQHQLSDGAINENQQIIKIFNFLAVVSVLLALVGLYTLVSLTIIKKTKEIGIRKVLGASYQSLLKIINRDFAIIILLAGFIGGYLGYFATKTLMGSIWTYFLDVGFMHIFMPVLLIIIVAIITIFRKVYLAANFNPVEALKYE